MVSSNTYIEQFGKLENLEVSVIQSEFDSVFDFLSKQADFQCSNDSAVSGIYPAQNPMPRGIGLQSASAYDFSDSPNNDPTRLNFLRWAYGRSHDGLSRYGTLRNHHGVLISQKEFELDNEISCGSFSSALAGSVLQKDWLSDVDMLVVQDLVVVSDVTQEQFDFLLTAAPVPYSTKNPVDSDVYIRLSNHSVEPLDPSTIVLRLNGEVMTGVTYAPFYAGYGGLDITWSNVREFDYGSIVDVVWEVYDTASPANCLLIQYWFTTMPDERGPFISNQSPRDDSVGVSITTSIVFDLLDNETGVDISSLEFYVNNKAVLLSDPVFTVIEIAGGYRIQYTTPTPFLYGDAIPVVVKISDLAVPSNSSFFVWSFTTEGSLVPSLMNMEPAPCDVNVSRIRNISFEVVDSGHGLDKDSIIMTIDNKQKDSVLIIPIVHRFE